ncbi:MAG: hypothetical protein H6693_05490 [Candidatus Latescibacteria bacterium]|nr:hypothetical protein [Candidatus Latescibacterota bacterium]
MKRVYRFALILVFALLTAGAAPASLVTNPHFLAGTDGWDVWLTPSDEADQIYCDGDVLAYDATTLDLQANGCHAPGHVDEFYGSIARLSQRVTAPLTGEYELRLRYDHYLPSHCVDQDQQIIGYYGMVIVRVGDWQATLTGYEEGWLEESFVLPLSQGEHELSIEVVGYTLDLPGYYCSDADHAYLDELDLVPLTTATESLSLSAVKSRY